jgi:zinc protease
MSPRTYSHELQQFDALGFGSKALQGPYSRSQAHFNRPSKSGAGFLTETTLISTGLVVLNTVLGGYFGSRLMTNIREKKGFTYNIYSTVDAYSSDGCMYIATEVSPEKSATAVRAIFKEMKKLCEEPLPEEELSMVRNYILGMMLNGLDGPINSSDMVRNQIVENQSPEKFEALVQTVRGISAETLQHLAQQYLQPKDFWVVTVD